MTTVTNHHRSTTAVTSIFSGCAFVISTILICCTLSCLVVGCDSYIIQPKSWEYKSRYDIGYEVATAIDSNSNSNTNNNDSNSNDKEEPILLLNGFGVGSFHQHRLIPELLLNINDNDNNDNDNDDVVYNDQRTVYCIDYLGQGRSWPKDCQDGLGVNEEGLQYSANT